MSIFNTEPETHEEAIQRRKLDISRWSAETLHEMDKRHTAIFNSIWNSPDITPQEIFDAYGGDAVQLFILSRAIQGVLAAAETGYVPLLPPYSFTVNPDGTVTVGDSVEPPATPDAPGA